jgi:hypothetical protein
MCALIFKTHALRFHTKMKPIHSRNKVVKSKGNLHNSKRTVHRFAPSPSVDARSIRQYVATAQWLLPSPLHSPAGKALFFFRPFRLWSSRFAPLSSSSVGSKKWRKQGVERFVNFDRKLPVLELLPKASL